MYLLFHIFCFILFITQHIIKSIFFNSICQFIVSSLRCEGGGGQVRCTWTRLHLVRSVLILESSSLRFVVGRADHGSSEGLSAHPESDCVREEGGAH